MMVKELFAINKDLIANEIIKRNEKFQERLDASSKELSGKAETCKAVIMTNDFGCRASSVAKLVSAILGEEIIVDDEIPFTKALLIIYEGEPWLTIESGYDPYILNMHGKRDYMDIEYRENPVLATREEIVSFINNINEDNETLKILFRTFL